MFCKMVVTGEGKSDIGICHNQAALCSGADYDIGPVAFLLVKLLERHLPEWNADQLDFSYPESWVTFIYRDWFNEKTKAKSLIRQAKKCVKVL